MDNPDNPYGWVCARCGQHDAYDEAGHPTIESIIEGEERWCPGPMVADRTLGATDHRIIEGVLRRYEDPDFMRELRRQMDERARELWWEQEDRRPRPPRRVRRD